MGKIIDGKKYAQEIQHDLLSQLASFAKKPSLHIVYVGRDPVIDNFISYKKQFGEALGVEVQVHHFDEHERQEVIGEAIKEMAQGASGIIVQLPLPEHLNAQELLDTVPAEKDIDVLSTQAREEFSAGKGDFFPPVTGAIEYILTKNALSLSDKNIVLVGNGNLVGYPTALWLEREGYSFRMIDKDTHHHERDELFITADIIISGAGMPGLIRPSMVKEGVVLFDAGTSESGKKIVGDIHPDCAQKASLLTPVPGGIGPLTIAILYSNLVQSYHV